MKIGIVGHFALGKKCFDGQTVKTIILKDTLAKKYGDKNIRIVDTNNRILLLLTIVVKIFFLLKKCDNIIILPAQNGLRILVPIINFWNTFLKKNIHYCVIGGWLPSYLENKIKLKSKLMKYKGIYVETQLMKSKLENFGFSNIFIMPNFKDLPIIDVNEKNKQIKHNYCTFSRVMKEKGIIEAIEAIKIINEEFHCDCSLDIYGQIDKNQYDLFNHLFQNLPSYINYKGIIPYDQSSNVLKNYYALLFPTYYEGEGFAGTILDGLSAGLPVIASDWKYNSEIINESVGILVKPKDINGLVDAIKKLNEINYDEYFKLKKACISKVVSYQPDVVIEVLTNNF